MDNNLSSVYLHIPKCGGSTLNSILRGNFKEENRFYVDPSNISNSRRRLAEWSDEEKRSIRLLHGHLSYGWHELLPQDATYFTVVRDPVSRVVSHYNYVRFRTDHSHYLRETVEEEDMSIAEYVTSGVCDEMNNGMVRLLAGVEDIVQEPYGDSVLPYGTNDPALLERALENIDNHFVFVGLQEHFDESLLLLRDELDVDTITYSRQNTGSRHYEKRYPDDVDREAIHEYNELDIELYRRVRTRFEEALDTLVLPNAQVAWLRLRNVVRKHYRNARTKVRNIRAP
ncbi:hypothetical protein GGP77_002304 [Salinibacter ruber]|uniref:sulfotransferase family protein n=1 Tax=Salinibacter ruber TaxID=146919 RepID=UPI002167E297|nr:sulfotransferase family protein [Salinibacter ruber]MCS3668061.1 hypothetical protein [Salinibacter ruber]